MKSFKQEESWNEEISFLRRILFISFHDFYKTHEGNLWKDFYQLVG